MAPFRDVPDSEPDLDTDYLLNTDDYTFVPVPEYDEASDTYTFPDDNPALRHANLKRQYGTDVPAGMAGIPGCVTRCMVTSNAGFCASSQDYLCLCSNHPYQAAVTQCWATRCNATSFDLALSYASAACTAIGAKISLDSNGASTNLTLMPIVYSRAAFNIQAVMSSLCSVVLLCAIGLGILSCRSQARRQAMMSGATAGAWSHATNPPTAKSRVSRVPRSYFPGREHGQISTVDMGSSVDFSEMFGPTRPPRPRQPRFTNRLPHEKPFTNRLTDEEWEMAEGSGSGSGTDDKPSVRFSVSSKGVTEYDEGSEVRHAGSAAGSAAPLNPPSAVYMGNASSASLQPAPPGYPSAPPRPLSAPPSPRSPHTYAPEAAHAK